MKDALGNEVNLYDVVGYAYNEYGKGVRLRAGIVIRFTPKSMEIVYNASQDRRTFHREVVLATRVIKTDFPDPLTNKDVFDRLSNVAQTLYENGYEGVFHGS